MLRDGYKIINGFGGLVSIPDNDNSNPACSAASSTLMLAGYGRRVVLSSLNDLPASPFYNDIIREFQNAN